MYIARICGHKTKVEGDTSAFGTENTTKMPVVDGGVDYCLECIRGMAIRCGLCQQAIFIGDPVTLKVRHDKAIPEGATLYDAERQIFVGCLRSTCTDTIAERAGFWMPDPNNFGRAYVELAQSAFEQALKQGMGVIQDIRAP